MIARSAEEYLGAIGAWTTASRFPVLIDDGSVRAMESIARFVRAFKPESVVRVQSGAGAGGWAATTAQVEQAVARAWRETAEQALEEDPGESLKRLWRARGHVPPGLVVARADDPAWTAAAALAAGRGQPLVWISDNDAPRDLHRMWSGAEVDRLDRTLQQAASRLGSTWSELGDSIDAITVCASIPSAFEISPGQVRATTDRLGRLRAEGPDRWAWTGQIFGNPTEAAYRAMCALFLESDQAWLFDGYPKSAPWSLFSLARARAALEPAGVKSTLFESPGATISAWREATSRPVEAGIVFVNTKGNADFFELDGGLGYCGDVPLLTRPAAVYFVHSWSLQSPGSRDTLGGRWLERGAFAYYGSVNEPMLQGFTPSPKVAALMAEGGVLAGSVRLDSGPVWKLSLLGDPLLTLAPGASGRRVAGETGLEVRALRDEVRELIGREGFGPALRALVLAGEEETATKLATGLLRERRAAVTPEVARNSLALLVRAGRLGEAVQMFALAKVEAEDRSDDAGFLRDCLWMASALRLRSQVQPPEVSTLELLRANLRPEQLDQDLIDLIGAWARAEGAARARSVLDEVAGRQTETHLKRKAARAAEVLRPRLR